MELLSVPEQSTHSCHWSVPTLLMPWPYWLSAWDDPWSCWNGGDIWLLTSTDRCRSCPLWQPRRVDHGHPDAVPPAGAIPLLPSSPGGPAFTPGT